MDNGILAAGAQDIDFMIHGLFSYKIFGHEVWITTCLLYTSSVYKRQVRPGTKDVRPGNRCDAGKFRKPAEQ